MPDVDCPSIDQSPSGIGDLRHLKFLHDVIHYK
jgi:hypothetical protein